MKVLVKPESNIEIDSQLLEAQCELQFCILNGCLCQQKSGWSDDDTEDILF